MRQQTKFGSDFERIRYLIPIILDLTPLYSGIGILKSERVDISAIYHRWASASRNLTPASIISVQYRDKKHAGLPWLGPVPILSTGPKKCRATSAWPSTGIVPASLVFFIPVPYQTDQMSTVWQVDTCTHRHGQAAWILTCSMEMGMHHGHQLAA
jgi:hypothetical protein